MGGNGANVAFANTNAPVQGVALAMSTSTCLELQLLGSVVNGPNSGHGHT
jgi:hypothetical protein